MAIAKVNIASVEKFAQSIEKQKVTAEEIRGQFFAMSNEVIEQVAVEKDKAEGVLGKVELTQHSLNNKLDDVNAQLDNLYTDLAATPETITETSTDEEGNTTETEVPNPTYVQIQDEIGVVKTKISTLENLSVRLDGLKAFTEQQLEILNVAIIQINEANETINESTAAISSIAETAIEKLKQIKEVLHEYKETKINAPNVSTRGNLGGPYFGVSGNPTQMSHSGQFNHDSDPHDCVDYSKRSWDDDLGGGNTFYGVGDRHYAESMTNLLERQGQARSDYRGTCGLTSTANVLRQLAVTQATECDVLERARSLGACREPRIGKTGGGTTNNDILNLMRSYNLSPSAVYDLSLEDVAACVDRGGAMMMSVIAKHIRDDATIPSNATFGKRSTDHWVTVTGISRNRYTNEVNGVFIQDTGGHGSYSNIFISADNFNKMRKISDDFTGIAVFR